MEWDGEDWSDLTTSKKTRSSKVFDETHANADHGHELSLGKVQKEKLMGALRASLKIKISKKELEELLEKQQEQEVNKKQVGRASAEQVLVRLIKARHQYNDSRQGLWMPMLESIPEVS